jgi:hypothetical protein
MIPWREVNGGWQGVCPDRAGPQMHFDGIDKLTQQARWQAPLK